MESKPGMYKLDCHERFSIVRNETEDITLHDFDNNFFGTVFQK